MSCGMHLHKSKCGASSRMLSLLTLKNLEDPTVHTVFGAVQCSLIAVMFHQPKYNKMSNANKLNSEGLAFQCALFRVGYIHDLQLNKGHLF